MVHGYISHIWLVRASFTMVFYTCRIRFITLLHVYQSFIYHYRDQMFQVQYLFMLRQTTAPAQGHVYKQPFIVASASPAALP